MKSLLLILATLLLPKGEDVPPEPQAAYFDFSIATKEFLTGRIDYYNDKHFVEIPAHMAYRTKMYLLQETYDAYLKMYNAALKDGITLKIISATRTFNEQKNVWEDKWKKNLYKIDGERERAKHILQFSSMPGTSRHHWGTEIDLNSLSESYFESGSGKKIYDWLIAHADEYGFCQTYNIFEKRQSGYQEERWHWSYYPISNRLLHLYEERVTYSDIKGFSGDAMAVELQVIEDYILSVNQSCSE